MAEQQICPHCRRSITELDLAEFTIKLKREAMMNEFNNSDIAKKFNNSSGKLALLVVSSSLLLMIIMALARFDVNKTLFEIYGYYMIFVITVPAVLGLVLLIRSSIKLNESRHQFMSKRPL